MKQWIVLSLVVGWAVAWGTGWAGNTPSQGAAQMVLQGGNSGNVPFPHHRHQESQVDCMVCHELFPQEAGAVDRLKEGGQLKAKQVMNKLCVKCHRENKKARKPTGPVTCKTCHIKE